MTAWIVFQVAYLVGLPGEVVCQLAYVHRSRHLLDVGLALKLPSWRLVEFALYLRE